MAITVGPTPPAEQPDPDPETVELAAELAALLSDLRPASRFHLRSALMAAGVEGVGGSLVIEIPRKPTDKANVSFVGGKPRLIVEP